MPDFGRGADSRPLLLIVEDERALRKVMEMVLEGEGYEVLCAANGREGLEVLATSMPNLIITDYMMPEMDGAEMIREIKNNVNHASIPILLMSAAIPEDLPERDVADRFLAKGGELSQLLSAIEQLLSMPRKGGAPA